MNEPTIHVSTALSMADAEVRLRDALKAEGFGVLTEVDVQSVLREKINAEVEPYRILGVCNPGLAHAALGVWKGFGLIAPCNVALYDEGDHREVIAFDPLTVPGIGDNAELRDIAQRASDGIRRAVESLAAG